MKMTRVNKPKNITVGWVLYQNNVYGIPAPILDYVDKLEEANQYKQAKIDALMLEYCPQEMTPEQIQNWENHQKEISEKTT